MSKTTVEIFRGREGLYLSPSASIEVADDPLEVYFLSYDPGDPLCNLVGAVLKIGDFAIRATTTRDREGISDTLRAFSALLLTVIDHAAEIRDHIKASQ